LSILKTLPFGSLTSQGEVIVSKRLIPSRPTKATADSAFATLATSAFCMGAVVIGHQLWKFRGSRNDLICLVIPDVNATCVEGLSHWWRVVRVPDYEPYPGSAIIGEIAFMESDGI
jgi:hypothetical protein